MLIFNPCVQWASSQSSSSPCFMQLPTQRKSLMWVWGSSHLLWLLMVFIKHVWKKAICWILFNTQVRHYHQPNGVLIIYSINQPLFRGPNSNKRSNKLWKLIMWFCIYFSVSVFHVISVPHWKLPSSFAVSLWISIIFLCSPWAPAAWCLSETSWKN